MTMTPARSSPFMAMSRDPLHPEVIYRDQRCFVVRDIEPKAPVHLLIIPNMPINGWRTLGRGRCRSWGICSWWPRKWRGGRVWR